LRAAVATVSGDKTPITGNVARCALATRGARSEATVALRMVIKLRRRICRPRQKTDAKIDLKLTHSANRWL
jgi:hypothetical protein